MINDAQLTAILPVVDVWRVAVFHRDRLDLKDLGVDTTGTNILLSGQAHRSP